MALHDKFNPQWKVEIGATPLTIQMDDTGTIKSVTTIQDETGIFTIPVNNYEGKHKSDISLYDEVKVYFRYGDSASWVQVLGGHIDSVEPIFQESGPELINLVGRTYELQFNFKYIYDTWMYEHWATILGDIVADVNANISSNFTTNFITAVEQTTDNADTGETNDVYTGTDVLGQVFKPNEAYLATVVVKGHKSDDSLTDDFECRVYRCKDNLGADTNTLANVDWAQTIAGTLLGEATFPVEYVTSDSSNPQEISFQIDTPGLVTTDLYMLVFAKDTDNVTTEGYVLRYNTAGGYADGDYFLDGSRVSGDDLWFKLNAFVITYEDKPGYEAMREVSSRVLRDWYSNTSKEIQCIERYGSSVKTFTVGDHNVISLRFKRDVAQLINKIIVAGRPFVRYIPSNRDDWTESVGDWSIDFDQGAADITVATVGSDLAKIGDTAVSITRNNMNEAGRVELPADGSNWTASTGLNNKTKMISFWVSGSVGSGGAAKQRFALSIHRNTGAVWYRDVYVHCRAAAASLARGDYQLVTYKLPEPGHRRKWMDDKADDTPNLITWDDAEFTDSDFIDQIAIHLYDNGGVVTDGEIAELNIDGLHFILEDDNRIEINNTTSQTNYDTREVVIRDHSLDNYPDVESKAKMIRRLRGDGDNSWSGTPGDTKDIQIDATLTVVGNTDVVAGNTITVNYTNGNIAMDMRVHSVTQEITKEGAWRTTYDLVMLLPQINLNRVLGQQAKSIQGLSNRTLYAANNRMQVNNSSHTEEEEL